MEKFYTHAERRAGRKQTHAHINWLDFRGLINLKKDNI